MAENDNVNHPKHYTSHPSGIECIEITRHMGSNLANAFKYIWRCDLKKDAIEDLKKAVWYINDEIKMREDKAKYNKPVVADYFAGDPYMGKPPKVPKGFLVLEKWNKEKPIIGMYKCMYEDGTFGKVDFVGGGFRVDNAEAEDFHMPYALCTARLSESPSMPDPVEDITEDGSMEDDETPVSEGDF